MVQTKGKELKGYEGSHCVSDRTSQTVDYIIHLMSRRIQVLQATKPASQFIGRLPVQLHLAILTYLSIQDVARYVRTCRAARRVTSDELLWKRRWLDLAVERLDQARTHPRRVRV